MSMTFEPVPPPDRVPVNKIAESLGLLPGLRPEKNSDSSQCNICGEVQPIGSWRVWVPDSVSIGDSAASVIETCRQSYYNGHSGAWCLKCALKLGRTEVGNMNDLEKQLSQLATKDDLRRMARHIEISAAIILVTAMLAITYFGLS